jgi:hypothetical protein
MMIAKLERIWKEVLMAWSRCYPGTFLETRKKSTKALRIASEPAKIRTEHISHTSTIPGSITELLVTVGECRIL